MARLLHASFALSCLLCASSCTPNVARVPKANLVPSRTPAPRAVPAGTHEGAEESLLMRYADRDPTTDLDDAMLPWQSKKLVVAMVIAAGKDDPAGYADLLTKGARWGNPDNRQVEALPIMADGGRAFNDAFRSALSRLSEGADFSCPPLIPTPFELLVQMGAEPMWCFFISEDKLDPLIFRLQIEEGRARVDYVGLFMERPTQPVSRYEETLGKAPPLLPPKRDIDPALLDAAKGR